VGQTFKVLIDKKEAGRYIGRTEFDSVEVDNEVIVSTQNKLTQGNFYQVKINKAYDYDLEGELV
jgi:ribosomal protein S12 methylthiotransferase